MKQTAKSLISFLLLLTASLHQARAIQDGSGFNTTEPTNTDVANWTTGWGASGVTGWAYIGSGNDASCVYLGNNWVLTAGHVGAGTFTLQGTAYAAVPGSARSLSNQYGTADLTLFQIVSGPSLPALMLATSSPVSFSRWQSGSQVVMLGYGGGQGETWGLNTVTSNNILVSINGYSYESVDFETAGGTTTSGTSSVTNDALLVLHDSGGGDFIYDAAKGKWLLAGINEAVNGSDSYMVQLSAYATQINSIVNAVPEPQTWVFLGLGVAVFLIQRSTRLGNIFRSLHIK